MPSWDASVAESAVLHGMPSHAVRTGGVHAAPVAHGAREPDGWVVGVVAVHGGAAVVEVVAFDDHAAVFELEGEEPAAVGAEVFLVDEHPTAFAQAVGVVLGHAVAGDFEGEHPEAPEGRGDGDAPDGLERSGIGGISGGDETPDGGFAWGVTSGQKVGLHEKFLLSVQVRVVIGSDGDHSADDGGFGRWDVFEGAVLGAEDRAEAGGGVEADVCAVLVGEDVHAAFFGGGVGLVDVEGAAGPDAGGGDAEHLFTVHAEQEGAFEAGGDQLVVDGGTGAVEAKGGGEWIDVRTAFTDKGGIHDPKVDARFSLKLS